ncbi:hypothetical protein [Metabacillus halosaccharovorans]|uniref:sunset domain-containing protein n=1 Tax=Metabacillus halosaccharovorans TaxID=930124 RepID=UPI0031F8C6D9
MDKERKVKNKKSESKLMYFGKLAFWLLAGYLLFFTSLPDYIDNAIDSIDTEEASQVTEAVEPVPVPVQAPPTPSVPKKKVEESCEKIIRGNISSSGEKIYHVPGGEYYDATVAEEKFCTQAEAMAAGYRKSKR